MHRLSPVAASRDYSLVVARGLLVAVASLVAEHRALGMWASRCGVSSCWRAQGSRHAGFSSYDMWAQ